MLSRIRKMLGTAGFIFVGTCQMRLNKLTVQL